MSLHIPEAIYVIKDIAESPTVSFEKNVYYPYPRQHMSNNSLLRKLLHMKISHPLLTSEAMGSILKI